MKSRHQMSERTVVGVRVCKYCHRPESKGCKLTRGCCPTHHHVIWEIVNVDKTYTDDQMVARGMWDPKQRNFKEQVLRKMSGEQSRMMSANN